MNPSSLLANRGLSAMAGYLGIQKIPPPGSEDWGHAKMLAGLVGVTRNTRAALKPATNTYAVRQRATKDLQALVKDETERSSRWTDGVDNRVLAYLRRGANPDALVNRDESVLTLAVRHTRPKIVRALLDAGADPNNGTPIVEVNCLRRSLPILEMLLVAGADPEAGRETALEVACEDGQLGAVRMLIEHRANKDGGLWQAAFHGHLEIVQLLVGVYGVNPNDGLTGASRGGELEIVNYLIEAGANVNRYDEVGDLPITVAAERGEADVVDALLGAGADPWKRVRDGFGVRQMAWDLAKQRGHVDVLEVLRAYWLSDD